MNMYMPTSNIGAGVFVASALAWQVSCACIPKKRCDWRNFLIYSLVVGEHAQISCIPEPCQVPIDKFSKPWLPAFAN
eukprot:scaffold142426_cov17-Prasinocladus_malaysianus.AAC.1